MLGPLRPDRCHLIFHSEPAGAQRPLWSLCLFRWMPVYICGCELAAGVVNHAIAAHRRWSSICLVKNTGLCAQPMPITLFGLAPFLPLRRHLRGLCLCELGEQSPALFLGLCSSATMVLILVTIYADPVGWASSLARVMRDGCGSAHPPASHSHRHLSRIPSPLPFLPYRAHPTCSCHPIRIVLVARSASVGVEPLLPRK